MGNEHDRNLLKCLCTAEFPPCVWGILFGGYFGNVVDIVSETFFGHTVTVPALWFVPLKRSHEDAWCIPCCSE